MTRLLQLITVLLAALAGAACAAWHAAKQQASSQQFEREGAVTPTCLEGEPPLTFTAPSAPPL